MSSHANEENRLKFKAFSSILNPGFWQQLTNIKLNKLKLSQEPVDINGTYSCNLSENLPCLASFDSNSFNEVKELGTKYAVPLHGQLVCTNIMQDFIDYDKKAFLNSQGEQVWNAIIDGGALEEPDKFLSRFGLLVYADLKKYKYYYLFCFPAINYPKEVYVNDSPSKSSDEGTRHLNPSQPIANFFSDKAIRILQEEFEKSSLDRKFQRSYFIVKLNKNTSTGEDNVVIYPLTQYEEASRIEPGFENSMLFFAFVDPSSSSDFPGWPLRNFLCLIAVQFKLDRVRILRIRKNSQFNSSIKIDLSQSMVLEIQYKLDENHQKSSQTRVMPFVTGWEKNELQQGAPKCVDLSRLLDSKKLSEDAVNLNLRLMKWRLLPELDLDKIAATKCLLLGCGTLGCNVARGLLAWGVKKISIVDNSKISYSNPVRQTLYNFEDCTSTPNGAFKAEAAAKNLRRIHPTVDVSSHILSIPMPGHHISENLIEQTKTDVSILEKLIDDHDAIFLLMDTRESRWLPTVIAMSKQKLVINAAIGFDTFLLQRYGVRTYENEGTDANQLSPEPEATTSSKNQLPSNELGCYFCNDIVAPGDSTLDRTLDQQCTVSRPGVSMMVSAMAVELLASIISSRAGSKTPAPIEVQSDPSMFGDNDCESDLGIVPHSIRGNLSRYYIYMPTSPSFNKCSACSGAIIQAYRDHGFEFLHRAFDDPSYLEEIAGLKDLQNVSDNVWALGSDDDDISEYGNLESTNN